MDEKNVNVMEIAITHFRQSVTYLTIARAKPNEATRISDQIKILRTNRKGYLYRTVT